MLWLGNVSSGGVKKKESKKIKDSGLANKRLDARRLFKLARLILFPIIALATLYVANFSFKLPSYNPEHWGQMGDFFGGMLNPILAFASFIALLYTIRIQSEELRLTREEFKKSLDVQAETSRAAAAQSDIASRQYLWSVYENLGRKIVFDNLEQKVRKFDSASYIRKVQRNSLENIQLHLYEQAKKILSDAYSLEHQKMMDFICLLRSVSHHKSNEAFVSRQIFKVVARQFPSDFLVALFFYYGHKNNPILGLSYVVGRFPLGEEILDRRDSLGSEIVEFLPLFFPHHSEDENLFCLYVSKFDDFKELETNLLETF